MFTTTSSCCIATRRLRNNIRIIELDCLPVVFAGVEVHLGLDLEHEVPRVPAKGLGPEVFLLHKHRCICESKLFS